MKDFIRVRRIDNNGSIAAILLGTIHGCVGQVVARAEGEAVLTAIANKVASIELAGENVWRPNNSMRALDRLPISFRAA